MRIIVCVKQVLDPEMPPAKFRIDPSANRVLRPEGIPPVISPFDEQAVEAALRIKERKGAEIVVISLGRASAVDVVRHALSLGADGGILIANEAGEGFDSRATAHLLTRVIEKIGGYDLILCGRQAADWDNGQVGSIIAENLALPLVTLARSIEVEDGGLMVERATSEGYDVFEVPLPALVTVSSEIGQPRLPSGWGIIAAARKKIPVWTAQDIGAEASPVGAPCNRLLKLFIPATEKKCELAEGKTVAEAAANLALRLRQAGII